MYIQLAQHVIIYIVALCASLFFFTRRTNKIIMKLHEEHSRDLSQLLTNDCHVMGQLHDLVEISEEKNDTSK